MAPGRKRGGAKGAKAKSQLNLGDLVLAKVKGFPAWPAKISKPEDWERTPDPKKYFVQFFGTEEIAFVAPVDIQPFTSESKNKLLARCKGKTVKYFSQAVREICDTFEELQHKSSDSLKDGNDGESFQPDINSTDMVEDGMTTDGPSGETSFNDIVNHGPGLERCSHIHKDMDYEDEKPSVSPAANDGSATAVSTEKQTELCNDDVTSPKEESISTSSAGHNKSSKSGLKVESNGQKSKKIVRASKKKHDDDDGINEIHSPAGVGSAVQSSHPESTVTENSKDVIRKSSLHGSKNEVTVGVVDSESVDNIKKAKKQLKDKTHVGVADDLSKDVEGVSTERNSAERTGRKIKSEPGVGKDNVLNNGVLHPTKRSKCSDDVLKRSHTQRKNEVSGKGGNEEVKKSTPSLKTKDRLTSKGQTNGIDSGVLGEEDVLPSAKRRRRAIEAGSGSTVKSEDRIAESSIPPKKGGNSNAVRSVPQVPMKRRAVRICDDDDDEPKTPVHGGSAKGVDGVSQFSVSVEEGAAATETIQDSPGVRNLSVNAKEEVPSSKQFSQPSPNSRQDITEIVERQFSHSPGKAESEKKSSEEVLKVLVSPIKSPVMIDSYNSAVEPLKVNKPVGKVSGNVSQKKGQAGSFKASTGIIDGGHRSQSNAVNERSRPVVSAEKQKSTPKSSFRVADSAAVLRKPSESNLLSSERLEYVRGDRTTSLADSRNADSNKSMKHLIAVAQAKRKQAQSQNFVHDGLNYSHITTSEAIIRSPGSSFVAQPIPAGPAVMVQTDGQGYRSQTSLASPSSRVHHYASNDQPDTAEFEETRTSSGHRPAGGSLSGGTEAAVARDAFEGMIETLSRTKESIGRATRHAIDCAKHGIANEVVELLTRKLESESSFHRRVDLFFLVDSITQCSHSQKGIAGASYIPTVQAALPRLLGAAAPSGANARENRRQCLKVLKLWLERKILPDSLLRSYIEDIGASNEDASTGFFSKRPSRSERAVDDPIREMEGMLVDEYGSNATFHLPGFLSTNVFEEDDDDILNFTHREGIGKSTLELNVSSGEFETCSVTPNDRRHRILEDVDGELEMEDVSGHPKDEKFLTVGSYKAVQLEEISDRTMDAGSNNSNEVSPLREGSPPLPPDSPPPTPPLPSSPPPPLSPMVPPPPSSPSPPPPPPPPPPSQTYPPHPSNAGPLQTFPQTSLPLQALPPQTSTTPQHVHQYQSPMQSNVSLNTRLGAHVDAAVRGEMFPQQPSCFVPAIASSSREPSGFNSSRTVEYGHETYTNPQGSQSNQQFQTANVPLPPRAFQPSMLPQPAGGQFQYPKPAMLQHPYPALYGLTKPPDGPRRYGADEQWRPTSNEFSTDNQRGAWMGGGRTSLSSGPPFAQEGYFRPPMERPPTNNVGFQPTGQNIVPAGAPIPGHSGSLMMPCRPDINSWRPA